MACLKTEGKLPVESDELMIFNRSGRTVGSTSFRNLVGRGSRLQVEDFIDNMVFCSVSEETSSKLFNDAKTGGAEGRGVESGVIPALILSTLLMKKVRNSSHCSGESWESWGGVGLVSESIT